MNESGLCWPCAHGDHESCNAKCFCPKCWDDEDRACGDDDPHGQAVEVAALVSG